MFLNPLHSTPRHKATKQRQEQQQNRQPNPLLGMPSTHLCVAWPVPITKPAPRPPPSAPESRLVRFRPMLKPVRSVDDDTVGIVTSLVLVVLTKVVGRAFLLQGNGWWRTSYTSKEESNDGRGGEHMMLCRSGGATHSLACWQTTTPTTNGASLLLVFVPVSCFGAFFLFLSGSGRRFFEDAIDNKAHNVFDHEIIG